MTPNDSTSAAVRKYWLGLPGWLWIVIIAGAAVAGIQLLHYDQGMANGFTWGIVPFAMLLCLGWFTLFSSFSRGARWSVCLFGLGLFAAVGWAVRIEGMSGNIRFLWSWRWTPPARDREPTLPQLSGAGRADLVTTTPHDFPQFLGSKRDANVTGVKLARNWTDKPPEQVWRQTIGAGWSGFAVVNGYAVTMEQRHDQELITCYRVTTGELVWVHATKTRYEDALPAGVGPRSTPTIFAGRVYALGATGKLHCLDGATGDVVWEKDFLKEFGITPQNEHDRVLYGRANSPLIVDDRVVVPLGGSSKTSTSSLAAFHLDNGALMWKGGDGNISHSSPALADLAGTRQILSVNEDFVSGHDPKTGAELWRFDWPGTTTANANVSQAVPVPPDHVFVSKGYGEGAKLVQLVPTQDGKFETKEIYHKSNLMRTKFTNVTIKDGFVYGLSDGILECIELATGKRKWRDGRYGHGQILRVGEVILVMSEEGELSLVEATPELPNHVYGQIQALHGLTWNNLALHGEYLLVRNATEAACYRLAVE